MFDIHEQRNIDIHIKQVTCATKNAFKAPWWYSNKKSNNTSPNHYILMYIDSGYFYRQYKSNKKRSISQNSFILWKSSKADFKHSVGSNIYSYYSLHFYTYEPISFDFSNEELIDITPKKAREIELKFIKAKEIYEEKPFAYNLALKSILQDLLRDFLISFYDENDTSDLPAFIRKSIGIIDSNKLNTHFSVLDIARECHVTSDYLIKTFKKHLGITPKQYINKLRFEHALELLKHTNKSIFDIAEMSGYTDSAHFGKDFKTRTGLSPSEYRKDNK